MTYDQILNDLKNKIYKPVYLLYGEESYFIDKITDYIAENVLTEQEKADLLALEGELPEEETPKNPYLEQTGESIEGDDDFVDTK